MDRETIEQIREASSALFGMATQISGEAHSGKLDYDLTMARVNRAGKAIATIRDALERVPEDQR